MNLILNRMSVSKASQVTQTHRSSRFSYDQITPLYMHNDEVYLPTLKKKGFKKGSISMSETARYTIHIAVVAFHPSPVNK